MLTVTWQPEIHILHDLTFGFCIRLRGGIATLSGALYTIEKANNKKETSQSENLNNQELIDGMWSLTVISLLPSALPAGVCGCGRAGVEADGVDLDWFCCSNSCCWRYMASWRSELWCICPDNNSNCSLTCKIIKNMYVNLPVNPGLYFLCGMTLLSWKKFLCKKDWPIT